MVVIDWPSSHAFCRNLGRQTDGNLGLDGYPWWRRGSSKVVAVGILLGTRLPGVEA
jgi:hypothetical protein